MFGAATHIRWLVPAFILAAALAVAPSTASAAACPSADVGHLSNCGPMYSVPTWTDAGGWDDPSQYATIQLADVNGDGADELIGRGDAGVVIYWFDTAVGQWRPQAGPDGTPWILTDFASKPPWDEGDPTNPANLQYSSTIQAADIDGKPGAEILGRLSDGMHTYQYTPPAGGNAVDGGTWKRIGTGGPFSDAAGYGDPSLYSTIQVGRFNTGDLPLLFARKHSQPGDNPSLAYYAWQNGAWSERILDPDESTTIYGFSDPLCSQPSCYLSFQTVDAVPPDSFFGPGRADEFMGRARPGVMVWDYTTRGNPTWFTPEGGGDPDNHPEALQPPPNPPFADYPSRDCPFSTGGAQGAGSGDCLGSSPSYYETLQGADVDGDGYDELIARASDGLRVYKWDQSVAPYGGYRRLGSLIALAGAPGDLQPGQWGSIRTGDIDGNGREEVLALGGDGLQAWSYDPAGDGWRQVQPSAPLALAADPWLTQPEHYATIQVGDVDGDKRADVIARGPYGIRTFFYDRRRTGGWERYLPEGYPDFPTDGQKNAFKALNTDFEVTSIRSKWTQATEPDADDLLSLQSSLGTTCTGKAAGDFPRYQSCTPQGTPTDYTADDWTTVINQLLAEVYYARQTTEWFGDLGTMKDKLFIQENAQLPAIGGDLGLQVAAGSSASFNAQGMWAGGLGIAASLAGLIPEVGPELSAALWVSSEATSMLPATSPTASSTFSSTYAGLQDKYAAMMSEMESGRLAQSMQARSDAGLAALVGQLRARGTWQLDTPAMTGAANQGFASWAYAALMPTVYDRYDINGCRDYGIGFVPAGGINQGYSLDCVSAPNQAGVHYQDSQTFIGTGEKFGQDNYPCYRVYVKLACAYDRTPDSGLSTKVWGPLADDCTNTPGKPETQWTFAKCNVAVDLRTSVTNNGWNYTSYSGTPDPPGAFDCMIKNGCGVTSQAGRQAPIRLRRSGAGDGGARLEATLVLPGRMRLAGATVKVRRVLFERGHRELTAPRRTRRPKPLALTLTRTGERRFAAASTGRRRVRVGLRRRPNGHIRLTLSSRRLFHAPRACHALPASVARATGPMWLHSSLVIGDGARRQRVRLHHHLRCRRDANGNVSRLVAVRHPERPVRPGLDISLRGPRSVEPGAKAHYVARVRNRRHTGGDRMASSLWDVGVGAGERRVRIRELRAGDARRIRFSLTVPQTARGRICAAVAAGAPGARADRDRACSRVR